MVGQGQAVSSSASSSQRSTSSQSKPTSNVSTNKSALVKNAKKGSRALLYVLVVAPLTAVIFIGPILMILLWIVTGGVLGMNTVGFVSLIVGYVIALYFFRDEFM